MRRAGAGCPRLGISAVAEAFLHAAPWWLLLERRKPSLPVFAVSPPDYSNLVRQLLQREGCNQATFLGPWAGGRNLSALGLSGVFG